MGVSTKNIEWVWISVALTLRSQVKFSENLQNTISWEHVPQQPQNKLCQGHVNPVSDRELKLFFRKCKNPPKTFVLSWNCVYIILFCFFLFFFYMYGNKVEFTYGMCRLQSLQYSLAVTVVVIKNLTLFHVCPRFLEFCKYLSL